MINKERVEKILKCLVIFAIACCCVLLLPQVRRFIIEITEKIIGRELKDHSKWMRMQLRYSLYAICLFSFILILLFFKIFLLIFTKCCLVILEKFRKLLLRFAKYCLVILDEFRKIFLRFAKYCLVILDEFGKKIFVIASIVIVLMSIIVRIIMYIKCRSLWLDEAMLAESIVSRNWFELLVPPLSNLQSAPVFYVIAVKFICQIFGYSEFTLRVFSLLSFFGLLICEGVLLKKAFNFENLKIAFVVAMTALLPSYIWYSNELKPYMGDAFFVVLIFLLYYFYTQEKIKLPLLTILFILVLGFSTPAIFFVGGIIFFEFLIAIFNKNKKQIFKIVISGTTVLIIFGLYYYWWMLPVTEGMKNFWGMPHVKDLLNLFSSGAGNSDSSIIKYLIPFAILGIYSLSKLKNKIAFSAVLSLIFVFLASLIGYWPLTPRLWLFLPVIVLVFTPVGIEFIYNKIKYKIFIDFIEYFLYLTIIICLSINCLRYINDKMYYSTEEVNSLIHYVKENIKEDERLYVYPMARAVFEFKNGYNTKKIGNVIQNNIIYGRDRNEWNEDSVGDELLSILENKKTYLLFQHYWVGIDKGLSVLKYYGTLTEVMNVYNTPLYYFKLDENKEEH